MPDIARQIRLGSAKYLNFDTQQKLLQQERERKARQEQQDAMNENITKLALNLESPAGVAATRRILGDTGFDVNEEMNFRRLKALISPSLQHDQIDFLNPLAEAAKLPGRFSITPLSKAKLATQEASTTSELALANQRLTAEQLAKDNQKLAAAESKARLSKINSDLRLNKLQFAKEIGGLFDKVSSGKLSNEDITKSIGNFDKLEKAYSDQAEDLTKIPDFYLDNPDYDEDDPNSSPTINNPKYDSQVSELARLKKQARDKKIQILSTILGATGDAQQLDQMTGGAVAGNAAESLRQRLAMQLIEQEFPQLAAQMRREQELAQLTEQLRNAGQIPIRGIAPGQRQQPVNQFRQGLTQQLTNPTYPLVNKPKLDW